jgi:hypothetical protein
MQEFANSIVALPDELKIVIAGVVLALVYAVLKGRVADEVVGKIAVLVSTAVIGIIEIALGLIPAELEAVAVNVLQLIVLLGGWVVAKNLYFQADERGLLK